MEFTPRSLKLLCLLWFTTIGQAFVQYDIVGMNVPKVSTWEGKVSVTLEVRGLAQPLKKSPYHYLHQTLPFEKCSQAGYISPKPILTHQTAKLRSVFCQCFHCSYGSMLYATPSNASHCTCWCETCMQLLGHGNLLHKAPAAPFLCWY